MTDEQIAATVNAQAVMALAVIQGMVAENQNRESQGKAQAYSELTFFAVRDELEKQLQAFNLL